MNNPEKIIIDAKYIREDLVEKTSEAEGNYVILRCSEAGVHSGYLESRANGWVKLTQSRRLWKWWSKFTLSGLATCGVLESKRSEVKFSCVMPEIEIRESDICEVLYCTTKARESIESIPEHTNE